MWTKRMSPRLCTPQFTKLRTSVRGSVIVLTETGSHWSDTTPTISDNLSLVRYAGGVRGILLEPGGAGL